MREICCLAVLAVSAVVHAQSASTPMSHEEAVVRASYAKATYLTQLEVASHAAISAYAGQPFDSYAFTKQMEDGQASFNISNVKVGALSDVANQPWGTFLTTPDKTTHIMQIAAAMDTFSSPSLPKQIAWTGAKASWLASEADTGDSPSADQGAAQMAAMPVSKVLQMAGKTLAQGQDVTWERYATFEVTATLKGDTVGPYRATFLFGIDSKGQEVVAPEDLITDRYDWVLPKAVTGSLYPKDLLRSPLRDTQVLSEWLQSSAVSDDSCVAGKGQLCCSHGKCGVSSADLKSELAQPAVVKP